MSNYVTILLIALYCISILIITWDLYSKRNTHKFLIQISLIIILFLITSILSDFPKLDNRIAFGETSESKLIVLLLVCNLVGILSNGVYRMKNKKQFKSIFKPLVFAPILLLPVIGSIDKIDNLSTFNVFSLLILSYQNGLFWKVIIDYEKI